MFSTTSIREVAIKANKRPGIFRVDAAALKAALVGLAYQELYPTSEHAVTPGALPLLHGDPFDRIHVAQAIVEKVTLATADRQLMRYEAPILYVG